MLAAYLFLVEEFIHKQSEPKQQWDIGPDQTTCAVRMFVFLASSFLLVDQELVNLLSKKGQYFLQIQNLYEWANIGMLMSTVALIQQNNMMDDIMIKRNAAFIIIGVSLGFHLMHSLRSIFLPFATFAVGLSTICVTLIPFVVLSCLALLMFVFIFRTYYYRFEDMSMDHCPDDDGTCVECVESFKSCFVQVLADFFSGPDTAPNHVLHIFYDFLSVIVLLNIVIAIVSSAWDKAADKASFFYWKGRLDFLSETRWLFDQMTLQCSALDNFFEWVDSAKGFLDEENQISWQQDAPYNQVQTRAQYLNPFYYFDPKLAPVIQEGHSLRADLHWIEKDPNLSTWRRRYLSFCTILKWSSLTFLYFLLLLLGFPTFSMLWPESFRSWLLSFGNKVESDEDDVDFLVLNEQIVEVGKRTDDLHTKLDAFMAFEREAKEHGAKQ